MQDEPLCFKVTLEAEAVTPLFLAGADPKGEPELRPPSIRGALRYWFRAAMGGVIGDQNIDLLRQMESAVFGSTNRCSPIRIRLRHSSGRPQITEAKILPHVNGPRAGQREAFAQGEKFELIMWQDRKHGQEVWYAACSALMLAFIFGGVGLRSRRGYGTIRCNETRKAQKPSFIAFYLNSLEPKSPFRDTNSVPTFPRSFDEWKWYVEKTVDFAVNSMRQLCEAKGKKILNSPPDGPTKFPCANKSSLIRLCNLEAQSATDAITRFMKAVPQHRALGGIKPRQSSPLWVRPIQTGDKYGLLFCVLASSFDGHDYAFVRKFLDDHFPGCDITVKGWNS